MKILVCVKQVPDAESVFTPNSTKDWIAVDGLVFRMNRYDEYAMEEALRIRDTDPSTTIDAVTAGPQRCTSTIRRAMEMGADRGIHILQKEERYYPPRETAVLLASFAARNNYDLILTGVMAEDDMHAQVGLLMAALLGLPGVSSVIRLELPGSAACAIVERETEGGVREKFEVDLPALLTVQSGINRPRYPSLSNVLKAKKKEIITIDPSSLADTSPKEKFPIFYFPDKKKRAAFLQGTGSDKAREMLRILHERSLL